MLSVVTLSVVMVRVVMLSVIRLNGIMPNVMAPLKVVEQTFLKIGKMRTLKKNLRPLQ
jgi:hypothetical protein